MRWAALRHLRAIWATGRCDVRLPNGDIFRLGDAARDDAALDDARPPDARPTDAQPTDARPASARIYVHDDRFFARLVLRGELGAGESFVAGEWSTDDLVAVMRTFLRGTRARGVESPLTRLVQLPSRLKHRRAANTRVGSERNVHAHYDLGNAFYRLFLDADTLGYSCGIYTPRASLADAQRAKFEQLCNWLELSPRDHLVEIGCGWGGMAIHAARTRGCRVTAITVSREQFELASARVAAEGLGERVTVEYRDYRTLAGSYDKIVSIEMLEAVGYEYLPAYFATCARVLRPGGRFALQSITMPDERFASYRRNVDWMQTYIFPGTLIPSLGAIRAATSMHFDITRTDDIGLHYAPTLRAWRERFVAALPAVRALGFDAPFIRTWLLYLAFSEAAFAERTLGDHQLLLARRG
jgi:cyclopropane-fatty-acyl-phospholipid synthase